MDVESFQKVPQSWDIADFLDKTAWFVAHSLVSEETAAQVASDVLNSRISVALDAVCNFDS